MNAEVWKTVAGYGGAYQASTSGRIRSVNRWVARGDVLQPLKGRILKPSRNKKTKYWHVVLCHLGKEHSCYVHRLVAETFIANPDGLREVNHKDLDKSNNAADNLEWESSSGNKVHAVANGVSFRGKPV